PKLKALMDQGLGDAEALATLLDGGGDTGASGLRSLHDAFAGDDLPKLKALMDQGLGDVQSLDTVLRDGCGDAATLRDLHDAFEDDLTKLNGLFTTSFDGDADKLAEMLDVGCDKDPAKLKGLHDAFTAERPDGSHASLAELKTMIAALGNGAPAK